MIGIRSGLHTLPFFSPVWIGIVGALSLQAWCSDSEDKAKRLQTSPVLLGKVPSPMTSVSACCSLVSLVHEL